MPQRGRYRLDAPPLALPPAGPVAGNVPRYGLFHLDQRYQPGRVYRLPPPRQAVGIAGNVPRHRVNARQTFPFLGSTQRSGVHRADPLPGIPGNVPRHRSARQDRRGHPGTALRSRLPWYGVRPVLILTQAFGSAESVTLDATASAAAEDTQEGGGIA